MELKIKCIFTGTGAWEEGKENDRINFDQMEIFVDQEDVTEEEQELWRNSLRINSMFAVALDATLLAFDTMDVEGVCIEDQEKMFDKLIEVLTKSPVFQKFSRVRKANEIVDEAIRSLPPARPGKNLN